MRGDLTSGKYEISTKSIKYIKESISNILVLIFDNILFVSTYASISPIVYILSIILFLVLLAITDTFFS